MDDTNQYKSRPRGRPALLTPERRQTILGHLRAGNYRRTAAMLSGVAPATFCRWMNEGHTIPGSPYADFVREVEQAECEAEAGCVKVILDAASTGEWKAAAWFLEHAKPKKKFMDVRKMEHSGPGGGPIETRALEALTNEELDVLARVASKVGGDAPEQSDDSGGAGEEGEG